MRDRIADCALVNIQSRLDTDAWMKQRKRAIADIPKARAHHVAGVLGPSLFIHGGQCGEANKTLCDWMMLDFGLQVWMKVKVQELLPD